MTLAKITKQMLVAGILVAACIWPAIARSDPATTTSGNFKKLMTNSPPPRAAALDFTFDHYLDQVIAGQEVSGALPFIAPPTLRGTFLAVRALQQLGFGAEVDSAGIQALIQSCFNASSHLFADTATNAVDNGTRVSGYSTIEASYYALATLDLLDALEPASWQATAEALLALQDGSGGFACRPGICTTHDAFFAYKALQLLGSAGEVNVDALASFLDSRQAADPDCWWEYGGFTNLPITTGEDADFTAPNLVTSYYAVATLSACGRLGMLNEPALRQFMQLQKNMSSNLFSYSPGNERAEHVGTAFLLALDQYLEDDSSITYAAAGSALLARMEAGNFNEGRRAPANHTLSAACEVIWCLVEGGRLAELSANTKQKLRTFITNHVISTGGSTGYALTNRASFHDLANLVPAITGAGKMDLLYVNALYAFIKAGYSRMSAYFCPDADAVLQHDLQEYYNPASPDGPFAQGIMVTLPALQVLKSLGRLNDFLGETHDLGNILGNITASQFLNDSAPAVDGAFCPQAGFATTCKGDEYLRTFIGPQWTLQALEAIAILDPSSPAGHYDAAAAWQYLSQFYVVDDTSAYFTHPAWINVTGAEWTCRVATALCKGGMASYFNPAKVNAWIIAHLDAASACEVAWHLRFLGSTTGLSRGAYAVSTLNTLQASLAAPGTSWYHAQGGKWPDPDIAGALAQLRADRQIYLLNPVVPSPIILGGYTPVAVEVSNLFAPGLPTAASVTFTALDKPVLLMETFPGLYGASYSCTYDFTKIGANPFNFTATKGGWQAAARVEGSTIFGGTLVASVACGGTAAPNGTTLAQKGSTITIAASLVVRAGAGESPAQKLAAIACVYLGGSQIANFSLAEGQPGIYDGSYATPGAGTYLVEIVVQGTILARFSVTLDGAKQASLGDLSPLPVGLIASSAAGGILVLGAGIVVTKRSSRKVSQV